MGDGILGPYIFMCYDKKFQRSTTNICFGASILVLAPQVYIELPLGSSRRELHFWAMGFGLLFHLGALKKISELLDIYWPCHLHFIMYLMYPRLHCPKNFNAHPGAKFEQYSNSSSYHSAETSVILPTLSSLPAPLGTCMYIKCTGV